jgi:hypothetical protein
MSRIKEAFRIQRSIECGEPQPTANVGTNSMAKDALSEIQYLRLKVSYFESVTTGSVHKRMEELTKHLKPNAAVEPPAYPVGSNTRLER